MTEGAARLRATLGIGGLFELVPDAVVVGDATTGQVVLWNAAAEAIFGYDAETASGMPLDRLVPVELRAQHLAGLARYARTGNGDLISTQRLVEVPAVCRDGRRIWIELRLAPLGSGEMPRYVVAVIRDVTARKLAEQSAEAHAQDAERAAASMRELLDMVSHDLRAPVAGTKGAIDLLRRRGDSLDEEKRAELLALADRQMAHVVNLLDDLLDLSKAEAGELDPQLDDVGVVEILRDAIETAGAAVALSTPAAGLAVRADRAHLRRVLVNLIGNAVKYGQAPITVSAERVGDRVDIHVDDCGPGVPPAFVPQLFDRFRRGNPAKAPGHGLGLSIARALVEASGGTITYQPLAPGARFTVSLPA